MGVPEQEMPQQQVALRQGPTMGVPQQEMLQQQVAQQQVPYKQEVTHGVYGLHWISETKKQPEVRTVPSKGVPSEANDRGKQTQLIEELDDDEDQTPESGAGMKSVLIAPANGLLWFLSFGALGFGWVLDFFNMYQYASPPTINASKSARNIGEAVMSFITVFAASFFPYFVLDHLSLWLGWPERIGAAIIVCLRVVLLQWHSSTNRKRIDVGNLSILSLAIYGTACFVWSAKKSSTIALFGSIILGQLDIRWERTSPEDSYYDRKSSIARFVEKMKSIVKGWASPITFYFSKPSKMTNPSSRESKRGGDETVVSSKLAGLIIGIIIISVLVVLGLFVVAVVKKMPEAQGEDGESLFDWRTFSVADFLKMLAEEIKKDRTMGISEKEAYKILQLKRGASEEETKKQYRRLSKEWHPDRYHGEEKVQAEEMQIKLNAAKDRLLPRKNKHETEDL